MTDADIDRAVALDLGRHFAIRPGGLTVGSGVITKFVDGLFTDEPNGEGAIHPHFFALGAGCVAIGCHAHDLG